VIPLARTGHHDTTVEHGLGAIERCFVHKRFEVALRGHAEVWAFDLAHVDGVPHHLAKALR
jgi:hypothetical protein